MEAGKEEGRRSAVVVGQDKGNASPYRVATTLRRFFRRFYVRQMTARGARHSTARQISHRAARKKDAAGGKEYAFRTEARTVFVALACDPKFIMPPSDFDTVKRALPQF